MSTFKIVKCSYLFQVSFLFILLAYPVDLRVGRSLKMVGQVDKEWSKQHEDVFSLFTVAKSRFTQELNTLLSGCSWSSADSSGILAGNI